MQNNSNIFENFENRFFSDFQKNEWTKVIAEQSRTKQNYFHFNRNYLNYQSFFYKVYKDRKQQHFKNILYQIKFHLLQNFQVQKDEYFKQQYPFHSWEMFHNITFLSKNSLVHKNVFSTKNAWLKNLQYWDEPNFQLNQYRFDETKQKLYKNIVQTRNHLFHSFYQKDRTAFQTNVNWLKIESLFYKTIFWRKKFQYKNKNRHFYNQTNRYFLQRNENKNLFDLENDFYEFQSKKADGNRNTDINFNSYFFSKLFFHQYHNLIDAFFSEILWYSLKKLNNQYQNERKYLDNYNSNNFFNWHKNDKRDSVYLKTSFYDINNNKNDKKINFFNRIFSFFDKTLNHNFFFKSNALFLNEKDSYKNLYLLEKSDFYIQQKQKNLASFQNVFFFKKQSQIFNENTSLQFLENDSFKYDKNFNQFSYFPQFLFTYNIDWKKNKDRKPFNKNKIFSKNKLDVLNNKNRLLKTDFYFKEHKLLFFKKYNRFLENEFYFESYLFGQNKKFSYFIKENNYLAKHDVMQKQNILLKSKQKLLSSYSDWLIQKKQTEKQIYEAENKRYFNEKREIDSFFIQQKFVFQNFLNKFYFFKTQQMNHLKAFQNLEEKLEDKIDILKFNSLIKNESFSIEKNNFHFKYKNDKIFNSLFPFWETLLFTTYQSKNFLSKNKFLENEINFFEKQQQSFFYQNFLYSFSEYPFENKFSFAENKYPSIHSFFLNENKKMDKQTYWQKSVIFDSIDKLSLYSYFQLFFNRSKMTSKNKQNFYQTNLLQKTKNFSFLLSKKQPQSFNKKIQQKLFFIQNKNFKKDSFEKENFYYIAKSKNSYDFEKDTEKIFYDFEICENAEDNFFNFYKLQVHRFFVSSELTNGINRNLSVYKKMNAVFLKTAKKNVDNLFLQELDSNLNLMQKQYFLQRVFEKEKFILNLQQKNIMYQQQKEELQTNHTQFDFVQNKIFVNQPFEKEKTTQKIERQIDFEQSYIYKKEKSVSVDVVELENKIIKSVFETLEKQFFENEARRKKEAVLQKEVFEQNIQMKQKKDAFSDTTFPQMDIEKLYEKIYERIERAIRIERRKIGR